MNKIAVIFTLDPQKQIENFQEVIKHEREVVDRWKAEGILDNLFLRQTRNGAVLIFKDMEENKAKELVSTLPLFPYIKTIEYLGLIKQF